MRNMMTTSKLKMLYERTTHGVSLNDACRVSGIDYAAAGAALRRLKHYMAMIMDGTIKTVPRLRKTYVLAAQWAIDNDAIKISKPAMILPTSEIEIVEHKTVAPAPAVTPGFNDRYAKLNLSFGIFSDAIYSFIEQEVAERYASIIAENTQLKETMSQAKINNWADGLKKRFEK